MTQKEMLIHYVNLLNDEHIKTLLTVAKQFVIDTSDTPTEDEILAIENYQREKQNGTFKSYSNDEVLEMLGIEAHEIH